ncbi:MAG TPA: orotidine-5'-phosphate decarboxylase [Phycisphaerales bacterium]|nr:orotidine-5'-phosphate decarboxylase [Phycisphaerales bacterium]
MSALRKLISAQQRTRSLVSVGLEPHPDYLASGFTPSLANYESFLRVIIDATAGLACAYKFNLAFFEALGPDGVAMLYRVRSRLPDDVLIIADAKRGDIGSTARCYASALYDSLGADSATVNPLMGRDSAEPFLAYRDKLTFFLALTSNPGASDFIIPDNLYLSIARSIQEWTAGENAGIVVGATRPVMVKDVRAAAPSLPFLIPGVGAQGGDLEETARLARLAPPSPANFSGMIFHVTRGVLPSKEDSGDPADVIRRKATEWRDRTAAAMGWKKEAAHA